MTRARRRLSSALGVAAVLLVGCQLLVPSEPPDFKCASAEPSACPSGMTCDTSIGRCVTSALTPEGGEEEDADVPGDATDVKKDADAPIIATEVGGECTANGDCKSQICGTSTILTTTIIPGASKPICTMPCCTSGECPTGFVCFGAGTGGNYCVPFQRAQRSAPGTKAPGASCFNNTECRSGLCSATRCVDTCCTSSDCTSPTTCRVKIINVPPPDREGWTCAMAEATGTKDPPLTCTAGTECKSDNCVGFGAGRKCRPSCCNNTQCTAAFGATAFCGYGKFVTTDVDGKWCFDPVTGSALGTTCNGDIDCASRLCDPESKKCVAACCRDSDCTNNTVCRPSPSGAPLLRCVPPR